MGAETRATVSVWAISMIIGAIIGVVIYVVTLIILGSMMGGQNMDSICSGITPGLGGHTLESKDGD